MLTRAAFLVLTAALCSCGRTENGSKPDAGTPAAPAFTLASDDFAEGANIPALFTCDDRNVSPELRWSGAPAKTKAFALIARDPDAPGGSFLHWAVAEIPSNAVALPRGVRFRPPAKELENDFIQPGYGGPCPPPGAPHRYVFTLYAADASFPGLTLTDLESFLENHTLGKAALTGLYQRQEKKEKKRKKHARP